MTQITSIKLGLIAICFATVPLNLAQMPRIGTSGRNQTSVTTPALAGHSGFSGISTSAVQPGTSFPNSTITAPNTKAGAQPGTNAGAQSGFRNQAVGITGAAAGLGGSSGNSTGTTGATQAGANARTGTNTTANTNAGTHTATAAATSTTASIIDQRQFNIPSPSPLGRNFSTAGESAQSL
jgi:hypothetical protein